MCGRTVISVPAYGVVTAPTENGGYLLQGVPPGVREVVLTTDDGRFVKTYVSVRPTQTSIGVDFVLAQRTPVNATLSGTAQRLVRTDNGNPVRAEDLSGMDVELVEVLDGQVVATGKTDKDGHWSLEAKQGPQHPRTRDAAGRLADSYDALGLADEAAAARAKAQPTP